jgi:putative zinc finger protein
MSQACAEWHGEIGAYVVGALSPAEAGRVLRHLRGCAGCRADYQDLAPVRDWLGRLGPNDGMPARQPLARLPLEPAHPPWHQVTRHRWTVAGAAIAAAAIAVIAVLAAHPAATPSFQAFDPATKVQGQAMLRATPTGTQIDLTISGLPAGQRCILVTVSPAGTAIAGTWAAQYSGTAHITGTSAIPRSQLSALRIEAPSHRLLLSIPVRATPQQVRPPAAT